MLAVNEQKLDFFYLNWGRFYFPTLESREFNLPTDC